MTNVFKIWYRLCVYHASSRQEQTNSKFISYHYLTILSDPVLWPRDRQNSEHFAPKHNIASSLDKVCGHYPQCTKVYLRPPKLLTFLDWIFNFFTHCFYSVCCLIWYLSSTFLLHYTLLLFPTSSQHLFDKFANRVIFS